MTINRTVADAIELYLERDKHMSWRIKNTPDEPLFYLQKGGVLSVGTLTALLKNSMKRQGVKTITAAALRTKHGNTTNTNGAHLIPVLMEAYCHTTQ